MIAMLPSTTTPGGVIILSVTDYNLTGKESNPAGFPTKKCPKCGRTLPLLDFIVTQKFRLLGEFPYLCFEEDREEGLCIDCYRPKTNFQLFLTTNAKHKKPRLSMRIYELHQADGQTVKLYDPHSANKRALSDRGLRLMDKTENKVSLQPQNDRSCNKDGNPYSEQ